jgi:hypothetical protein
LGLASSSAFPSPPSPSPSDDEVGQERKREKRLRKSGREERKKEEGKKEGGEQGSKEGKGSRRDISKIHVIKFIRGIWSPIPYYPLPYHTRLCHPSLHLYTYIHTPNPLSCFQVVGFSQVSKALSRIESSEIKLN